MTNTPNTKELVEVFGKVITALDSITALKTLVGGQLISKETAITIGTEIYQQGVVPIEAKMQELYADKPEFELPDMPPLSRLLENIESAYA